MVTHTGNEDASLYRHITQSEWDINLAYSREALRKNGVGEREAEELVALFQQYKCDIVESK